MAYVICRSCVLLLSGLTAAAAASAAEEYPARPVRIVTTEIGGSLDGAARLAAQGLTIALGKSVIVENRGSVVAQELVARATPDGYTLLAGGTPFWIGPMLQKMSYDPIRDFAPIAAMTRSPSVLVVYPALPVKSVKDLIALARAKPGELNYASGLSGSAPHLAAELFKFLADINITRISYKSSPGALNGLAGGETQFMFTSAGSASSHIKAGRLRALAVGTAAPSALVPDLPTVSATLPGYEAANMTGLFAPAHTPAAIVRQLNREIEHVLAMPAIKEKFFNNSVETVTGSPEDLAATVRAEIVRLGKVIKRAGINGG